MCACVQQNNAFLRGGLHGIYTSDTLHKINKTHLQIRLETLKVETDSVLVEIPISSHLETGVAEDWSMVAPTGFGEVDDFAVLVRIVSRDEGAANTQGTGPGDGLCHGDLGSR